MQIGQQLQSAFTNISNQQSFNNYNPKSQPNLTLSQNLIQLQQSIKLQSSQKIPQVQFSKNKSEQTPIKQQQNLYKQQQREQKEQYIQSNKKIIKKKYRKQKVTLKASSLLLPYQHIIPQLIQKPQKSKRKATNIPKFIIKIFYKTLPVFPIQQHNQRLKQFSKQLDSSITRFHLVELFGLNNQQNKDKQNNINRQVLKRLLIRNYDNILSNTHIQHKRIYMLFSKKMLLRLNEPKLVGNIQI